jgi:hypothetical protein
MVFRMPWLLQPDDDEILCVHRHAFNLGHGRGLHLALLLEAAPPPVQDFIGKRDGEKVEIDSESAMGAVSAAMRTMDDLGVVAIAFAAGNDTANAYTMDEQRGATRMQFGTPGPIGKDAKIGFKPKMLLNAIRACGSKSSLRKQNRERAVHARRLGRLRGGAHAAHARGRH